MSNLFNSDYMNGFNSCVELIINIITGIIKKEKSGDVSINDVLRLLRSEILKQAFIEIEEKKEE